MSKVPATIYAVEMPYEGVMALFFTREAAEAALADEDQYPAEYGCYVAAWKVN
jgi:hypothetical protein